MKHQQLSGVSQSFRLHKQGAPFPKLSGKSPINVSLPEKRALCDEIPHTRATVILFKVKKNNKKLPIPIAKKSHFYNIITILVIV